MDDKQPITENILSTAVNVLNNVNSRISALLTCSAEDFDSLNNRFREYHLKLNELTAKAEIISKGITNIPDGQLSDYKTSFAALLKDVKHSFAEAEKLNFLILNSDTDLAHCSLHINNLKQNTYSLKLLVTNIQLEPKHRKLYTQLNSIIKQINDQSQLLNNELSQLRKRINSCSETFLHITDQQSPEVLNLLKDNLDLLDNCTDKKAKCQEYDKTLSNLIEKKSSNSAEIITNLQFQDIVRQKIEHVQEMQLLLIKRLRSLEPDTDILSKDRLRSKYKIIYQIKSICTLQAAQLLHANNEYQKAVETIISKFDQLDQITGETIKYLSILTPKPSTKKEFSFMSINKLLSYFDLEFKTAMQVNTKLHHNCEDISLKGASLNIAVRNLDDAIQDLRNLIDQFAPSLTQTKGETTPTSLLDQISAVSMEINQNLKDIYNSLYSFNANSNNNIKPKLSAYFNTHNDLKSKVEKIEKLGQALFFDENKLSASDINDTKNFLHDKFDLASIKYYRVFEKEIEEIIFNLNSVIEKISFDEIEKNLTEEDLQNVEALYTMESEREIHAQITGKETPANGQKDHDDIELF